MAKAKLDWRHFWSVLKPELVAIVTLVFVVATIAVFFLNPLGSSSIEDGIVIRSMNYPDKYQATDSLVFVELKDKRVVNIYLTSGFAPPAPGTALKIRRVKRVLFGEYFMLAQ
jgi:hypothetical protein